MAKTAYVLFLTTNDVDINLVKLLNNFIFNTYLVTKCPPIRYLKYISKGRSYLVKLFYDLTKLLAQFHRSFLQNGSNRNEKHCLFYKGGLLIVLTFKSCVSQSFTTLLIFARHVRILSRVRAL